MFNFDDEFAQELIQKDEAAYNKFYNMSSDIFFRYIKANYFIRDQDALDLVADVYLKIWNGLDSYKHEGKMESRIRVVFKNRIKDFFKKKKEIHFSQMASYEDERYEDTLVLHEKDQIDILEEDYTF